MDHGSLVYKTDNLVQSSLSSSLVLNLIQDLFPWSTLRLLNYNIKHIVIISFLPELSTMFYYNKWSCDCVAMTCNIMLTLILYLKNTKEKKKKIQNKRENKVKWSPLFIILTTCIFLSKLFCYPKLWLCDE